MLKHMDYMDPWHVTQVLIDNSPLSKMIWETVKEPTVLPTYFYTVLEQYKDGVSVKQLLEAEVALRSQEKSRLRHGLIIAMDMDSTFAGKMDTLATVFNSDTLGQGLRDLYWMYLLNGKLSDAAALEGDLRTRIKASQLADLGVRLREAEGKWNKLTPDDLDFMLASAFAGERGIGAVSWAALLALDKLDSLPTPTLPGILKSLSGPDQRSLRNSTKAPVVAAYPNPAQDLVRITFDAGMADGQLEVFDAQGRLMETVSLNGQRAFAELDLVQYGAGLYLARLSRDGVVLGDTKFTVTR